MRPKNESKHSEMGPVRQNPIQTTVRSVHVCALHCAQLLRTILHRTDLIIFPLTSRQSPFLQWCLFEGPGQKVSHRDQSLGIIIFESDYLLAGMLMRPTATRPRPVMRPRLALLASRPRPLRGLNILASGLLSQQHPGTKVANYH